MKILQNEKSIIAIWGRPKQGKSDTVKRITKLILSNYPNARFTPLNIDYAKDIKVLIEINKIKIGIESQGDPNSRIFDSLNEFSEINCDLIICSTRSAGGTVNAVHKLTKSDNYNVIWSTNHRSENDHDSLNDLSAKQVFEMIQNLLVTNQ
jgi:hypothetical protein